MRSKLDIKFKAKMRKRKKYFDPPGPQSLFHFSLLYPYRIVSLPRRVCLVDSVSASHAVGRGFAPHLGHTKDHDH